MYKPLPLSIWIARILSQSCFLADRSRVEKDWLSGRPNNDFDEIYQQLSDDFASGKHFMIYSAHPSLSPDQRDTLGKFLKVFEFTNNKATHGERRERVDSVALLHSDFWPPLEEAAKAVVKAFEGWEPPPDDRK